MNGDSEKLVYMDHAATTPLRSEALEDMLPYLQGSFGNPSSLYTLAQEARNAVDRSRRTIASLIGARSSELTFTSGGTESDNAAIKGGAMAMRHLGRHIITSAIEHHAVLHTCHQMEQFGFEVTYLPVDQYGLVSESDLLNAVTSETILVSIMMANNEIGTIQPISELSESIQSVSRRDGRTILFHTDAVQAAPWTDLQPLTISSELLSLSSHKIAGPMGIGALYVRPGLDLPPFVRGGGQQGGRRGGTEATALIVGFGAACARTQAIRDESVVRVAGLRDRLEATLLDSIEGARRNGSESRLPNTCHMSFAHCDGNVLVARLDLDGVSASAGAACASGVAETSPVIDALRLPAKYSAGSLRLSLGYETTESDVDRAIHAIPNAVHAVRESGLEATR